jgi:hypothetical protein
MKLRAKTINPSFVFFTFDIENQIDELLNLLFNGIKKRN